MYGRGARTAYRKSNTDHGGNTILMLPIVSEITKNHIKCRSNDSIINELDLLLDIGCSINIIKIDYL